MSWRMILVAFIIFCAVTSAHFALSIREPELPNSVQLPLGEVNRQQSNQPPRTPLTSGRDVTLAALPKEAWCEQVNMILENISLDCYWPGESRETTLHTRLTIELPRTGDVTYWKFDRSQLQAVPQSHGWLVVNLGRIIGAIAFALFATLGTVTLFYARKVSLSPAL